MSKTKSTKRSTKSLAPVVAAMTVAAMTSPEDAALNDLLNSIAPGSPSTETIESDASPVDSDIAAAVESLESAETVETVEVNAADAKAAKAAEKAAAKVAADAIKKAAKEAADKVKADEKVAKATARAEAKAAKAAAKAAEPPKAPRVKYENKTDLMKARLGANLGDFMVLEVADAALSGDELAAKQAETLATIDGMSQKVKNRANFLMTYMHSGGKLNEVVERAFKILKKDGQITTGDKGNLHLNLIARPYSAAAARAMGGNTVNMLKTLKVLVGEKGVYTPNADSLILMKVNGQLGL
jgi:chemotaxis protein histidine kinase CheA